MLLDGNRYKIRPYFRDIRMDLQESDTWKIQLTIGIKFISSKDAEEEHVIHSKSNNIKFTFYNNVNEAVHVLFKRLNSRYQDNLEMLMRKNDFIVNSLKLFYYKCHRNFFRYGG